MSKEILSITIGTTSYGLFDSITPYFLASPSSHNVDYLSMQAWGRVSDYWYNLDNYGIRPLVSIPIDSVNVEGTKGNYTVSINYKTN